MNYSFQPHLLDTLSQVNALLPQARQAFPRTSEERDRALLDFLISFVHHSAGIEGVHATLEQTERVLRGLDEPQLPMEIRVQLTGYRDAFYFMRSHLNEPLSQDMIRFLHFLCTPMGDDQRGRYRDVQIHVVTRTQLPPEPEQVPQAMDELMQAYHQCTLPPVLLAAWFHLHHESIHPLHLANGRTERILVNYLLMRHGYLPVCIKQTDRQRYLASFAHYYKTGDITPMAEYLLELEKEVLLRCISRKEGVNPHV